MPITLLDIILLVVMLISALLAMVRGFMREILSLTSWVAAAVVAYLAFPKMYPLVQGYISNDIAAKIAAVAIVFLGTLLIVAVVTIRISDTILDSRIGALDRTLGFIFGLGRGLLIVVVAFLFFNFFAPEKSKPAFVKDAKSRVILESTGDWLMSKLPDVEALYEKYKQKKREDQDPDSTQGDRSGLAPASRFAASGVK
jgi:membrane protein required for colicin V production